MEYICIFCNSIVGEPKLENIDEHFKQKSYESAVTPYRTVECPCCGTYVRPDSPWFEAMGYDISSMKELLTKRNVPKDIRHFMGDERKYKEFVSHYPEVAIRFVRPGSCE